MHLDFNMVKMYVQLAQIDLETKAREPALRITGGYSQINLFFRI